VKLLLVEDDKKIATAVKRGLEAEDFSVDVAFDGDDGWWMATEGSYDLIVLDIMLPGRNGYVLCADLRNAGNWTPILMLTAKDGDLDEAEALDTGADDYLTKPFSFPVLIARVRSLLRRAGGREPVPAVVGSISLDSSARRVRSHGDDVALTTREFDVLEFLIRRGTRSWPVCGSSISTEIRTSWRYTSQGFAGSSATHTELSASRLSAARATS